MYSLKNRIARNLTLNLVVVMCGLLVVMYFFTQQLLHDYILTRLQHDTESLVSVLERGPEGSWRIGPGRMSTVYDRVRSGHYFYVVVDGQSLISRSLFDADFPLQGAGDSAPGDYSTDGPGDERWLVWRQHFSRDGAAIGVWVAEDIAPVHDQLLRYFAYTAALIGAVGALLIYLQQRTLRDAFRVFEWLRRNLATIRQKQSGESGIAIPAEIEPLVSEIEQLVADLAHRITRTRHAMGNLAHELKRPLQLLAIQLDRGSDAERRRTLDEIRNILERELRRARISGSARGGGVFDVTREMDDLADVLRKIYPTVDLRIEFANRVETLDLDRDDLLELSGNLLDNACKFARSRVRVTIDASEERLTLCVEDDGDELDPDRLKAINRRGVRLDETVAGHGLGLGICHDILEHYRGELAFDRSSLGGLRATVHIPLRHSGR